MSIAIADSHKCIERSTDCDCPICGEYMFNSPETVVFMPCGHSIHLKCYYEHVKTSYRCPLCSKSMVNMETSFRNLDRAIESQPMPTGFRDTKALVYCNDCAAKSSVPYHWLGLKCGLYALPRPTPFLPICVAYMESYATDVTRTTRRRSGSSMGRVPSAPRSRRRHPQPRRAPTS